MGWGRGHWHGAGATLTRCLQPASLKGHSSMAVLQLSFRWLGMSSRAMLGVPHWLGQGTGYRGHWYWWFWGQRTAVRWWHREPSGWPRPHGPRSHLEGVEDELLGAVGAGLRALGALGQGVLGQQAPHHAGPALVLAVHALLGTRALVALGTAAAAASPTTARICPHPAPPETLLPPPASCVSPSRPGVSPTPVPTSKASPVKSLAQNSHLTRRLGQPCCTCSGRSRRLSLALQRLGQGTTLKAQVPR